MRPTGYRPTPFPWIYLLVALGAVGGCLAPGVLSGPGSRGVVRRPARERIHAANWLPTDAFSMDLPSGCLGSAGGLLGAGTSLRSGRILEERGRSRSTHPLRGGAVRGQPARFFAIVGADPQRYRLRNGCLLGRSPTRPQCPARRREASDF